MVTVMQIILQPVLFELDKDILSSLEKALSKEFNVSFPSSIVTAPAIKEIPEQLQLQLFDKQRNQWKSTDILKWLSDIYTKLYYSKGRRITTKIFAICGFDAYSDKLNFVFGEAHSNGSISAIYLPRLRQEFYRLKPDKSVFCQRLVKEAVHEVGHAFGLTHCENIKCVMHFSNSLSDTDIKTNHLCHVCKSHFGIIIHKYPTL
jgi:archaemetzincin